MIICLSSIIVDKHVSIIAIRQNKYRYSVVKFSKTTEFKRLSWQNIIMYTNIQNYLQRKPSILSLLLAFVAVISLSACGVRGDLYQTPEPESKQPVEQVNSPSVVTEQEQQ